MAAVVPRGWVGELSQRDRLPPIDQHCRARDRQSLHGLIQAPRGSLQDLCPQQRGGPRGARRRRDRPAAHERTGPGADTGGVGLLDDDAFRLNAKARRCDLCERRLRALADRGAGRLHVDQTVGGQPDARCVDAWDVRHAAALECGRAGAGELHVRSESDPEQPAFAASAFLLLAKVCVPGHVAAGSAISLARRV